MLQQRKVTNVAANVVISASESVKMVAKCSNKYSDVNVDVEQALSMVIVDVSRSRSSVIMSIGGSSGVCGG